MITVQEGRAAPRTRPSILCWFEELCPDLATQKLKGDWPLVKRKKTSIFKSYNAKPETLLDKTTRIAMEMVDDETVQRQAKNTRLRKARLEREANTPPE